MLPQAWGQAPTVTTLVGSSNVPQTNSVTGVQAPPSSIVVQGTGFSALTTAVFGAYPATAPQVISATTMVVPVPAAFAASAVGTTTTLLVCNGALCATGGATITLTVTAPVPSAGTLAATPTPTTTVGTTTISAQFLRNTANSAGLPEPGAPSGTVSFTAAGTAQGSAPLVLDPTATFAATTTTTTVPATPTPGFSPVGGTYPGTQNVTITDANAGASIYYTTNGTVPTTASTPYTVPIAVSVSQTITAIALATGNLPSATGSAAYNIFTPIPTSLAFVQQPTDSVTGVAITPAVAVAILDQNNNVIVGSTALVTMTIASNPTQTTLAGTTSVSAVNGIATFSNLSIVPVANGYSLQAASAGLPSLISGTFNVLPPPITVTPFAPLVGVTSTLPGSFTLGAPAPAAGVTVNLASSVPANVTVSPATVTVAAGATTGSFTYTGVGPGAANLTASATNYQNGSATVTATYSLVSLGTIPSVAPAQSVSIALSIATAAPAGGLTVSFTSSNPSVATVTPSVFIPAGQRTAAANPQIVGVVIGTTTITASAPGYAPDTRVVPVTVVASFSPGGITIAHQPYMNATLNISSPATTGGLTFTLSSDFPNIATVPASVTILAGQTSVVVPVTGVADGQTTVRADSPGVVEATLAVNVSSQLALYYGNSVTGVNLYETNYINVPANPATPVTVTATVNNPGVVTISSSPTAVGTSSVTYTNVTSSGFPAIYLQGQTQGTATITISAPGFTTGTNTITVYPSGFILNGGAFSTTTFSTPTPFGAYSAILSPGSLTQYTTAPLNPGLANVSVPVTSSNTAIGTITSSPLVFTPGSSSVSTSFQPSTAGTTTLAIGAPTGVAGFSTPSANTSYVATVTAPQLSFYYGNSITGVNLQVTNYIYLPVTPPTATTFTVTSSNPAVATISNSQTTVGTSSVTYPGLTAAGTYPIVIQGQSTGTTTLTLSGAGYTTGTITVTVYPSGFSFGNPGGITTTSFSGPSAVYVYPTLLNPGSLTEYSTGVLNPGIGTITVPVTSSNTAVGTITSSPLIFNAGDSSHSTTFQPSSAGTSTIAVGAATGVSGFSTSANYTSFTATVSAPQSSFYYNSPIVGVNMISSNYAALPVNPPAGVLVTVTSSNPAVLTLSTSNTVTGTGSVSFPNVTTAGASPFFMQGLTTGTSILTLTAPGYTSATTTVTVYPSGFSYAGAQSFSTTTFSSPTTLYVYPTILNPGSLTYNTTGTLSPGIATVSVPVTSSNTTVGNITSSPVVFGPGSSSQATTFQPTAAGTSTVALGVPTGGTGYSIAANYTSQTATVSAPQLNFTGSVITGANMEVTANAYLPVAPPNPVNVTVTSNGPSIATVSSSGTIVGGTTLTFPNVTAAGYLPTIYVQGQGQGGTTLTVSAPGFTNGTTTVTVYPSGFSFAGSYNGGLSATAGSSAVSLPVFPTILNPNTLTYYNQAQLNPGLGGTSVAVTSSNTAAGTITLSPVVFNGGESYIYTTFQPIATGMTNIMIVQPAGFSTPSQYNVINATVQ